MPPPPLVSLFVIIAQASATTTWYLDDAASACAQTPVICPARVELASARVGVVWLDNSNSTILHEIYEERHANLNLTRTERRERVHPPTRIFPYNVYAGVEFDVTAPRTVTFQGSPVSASFSVLATSALLSSQRKHNVTLHHIFDVSDNLLTYNVKCEEPQIDMEFVYSAEERAVRMQPPEPGTKQVRSSANEAESDGEEVASGDGALVSASITAYNLYVPNNASWSMSSQSFQDIAMAISLQGLVNRRGPNLYLTYPDDWAFSYTADVRDFLSTSHGISFTTLDSPLDALSTLLPQSDGAVKGYVTYEPTVRDSLVVAYTIAGIESAVVASPRLSKILSADPFNLACVADLSAAHLPSIAKNTSAEIFEWAYETYGPRANTSTLVWLGGLCADAQMQPGIADYGVANGAFFVDLNTVDPGRNPNAASPFEYALADRILGALAVCEEGGGTPPLVCGWHSYCDDYEHTFTTLVSKHGARVHGLDTNPNLSFMSKLSLPDGYVFKNKGRRRTPISAARIASLSSKVLINLVQTDGLGLGAWAKGGRGTLPYVWEVTLPDLQIQPVILQMFYEQATANDTFVGALGADGYSYPKAIPKELLPSRLAFAQQAMRTLDLHHFVIFDASEAIGEHTVTGNTCLNQDVVSQYFLSMPDCVGFYNGYAPSFSFKHDPSSNHSVMSFDYYLDPGRSISEAISDIEMLARLNPVRPYYLAIHVREFSTVGKVISIVDGLDETLFEVVNADDLWEMANANPTFLDRFT